MQTIRAYFKPFGRWFILGLILVYLVKTLKTHWQEVAVIQISAAGYGYLTIAVGITLLSHIWAGWVWGWVLQSLNQSATGIWSVQVYLTTNIAKYLPGNVWHFYGRISAASKAGISLEAATLSVLLEPLLMVAAALMMALVSLQLGASQGWKVQFLAIAGLVLVLASMQPRFLNPIVLRLTQLKQKASASLTPKLQLSHYPLLPLCGEIGFLSLRGLGFIFTFLAIAPVPFFQFPILLGSFALSWLLGFITPGLPGGIGVFEAVAVALLQRHFPLAELLAVVALYRLINTLAEAGGAGLAAIAKQR